MTSRFFGAIARDARVLEEILARLPGGRTAGLGRMAGEGFAAAFSPAGDASGAVVHGCLDATLPGPREGGLPDGAASLARIDGNFAAFLNDRARGRLTLATDAAGTHPVYFSAAEGLVFGGSAVEVARASGRRLEADPAALARFLADGSVAEGSQTLFAGIERLAAGEALELEPGAPPRRILSGPDPEAAPEPVRPLEERAHALRSLLVRAVALLSNGRRVGIALSGGIDSSGLGAALRAVRGKAEALPAFCFVHDDPELPASSDERPWARLAAAGLGAALREVRLEAGAIPRVLERVARAQDFPFGSPVVLAQSEVFGAAAHEGVETLLSGHGPDYLFGGGDSHVRERAIGLVRAGRLGAAWRYLGSAAPYAGTTPWRLLDGALRQAFRVRPKSDPAAMGLRAEWLRARGLALDFRGAPESGEGLRAMIRSQLRARLPSAIAWEADNAAHAGLEVRFPYLVASIVRFAAALPEEQLVTDLGQTRPVLRLALRGHVPDPILDRPHPVGFAVPAVSWLRANPAWLDDRLQALERLPCCNVPHLRRMREALRGNDASAWRAAFVLWRWISVQEWLRAHDVALD